MQDEMYMARALKLAARGRFTTHPNPNVGCVIVKDGEIVGEGCEALVEGLDPVAGRAKAGIGVAEDGEDRHGGSCMSVEMAFPSLFAARGEWQRANRAICMKLQQLAIFSHGAGFCRFRAMDRPHALR